MYVPFPSKARGQVVITSAAAGAQALRAVDLDGDGDLDLLAAADEDWSVRRASHVTGTHHIS